MTAGVIFLVALALIVGLLNLGLLIALFRRGEPEMPVDDGTSALFRRHLEQMERRLVDIGKGIERMWHLRMYDTAGNAGRYRSEESRVGREGVSTCRSRWAPDH